MTVGNEDNVTSLTFPDQIRWHMIKGSRGAGHGETGKAWSNKQLASAIGISDRQLRNWLSGTSAPFSVEDLERVFFGRDQALSSEHRQSLRQSHFLHKYGEDQDLSNDEHRLPNDIEQAVFKDAVEILTRSLRYIQEAAIVVGDIRRSPSKKLESHQEFKRSSYERAIFGTLKTFDCEADETEKKRPTYSDLCLNVNNMIIFRKSVVELLQRVLHSESVEQGELNDLCSELDFQLWIISESVEQLYEILSDISKVDPDSVPRKFHVMVADTESASSFIVRILRQNEPTLEEGENVFRDPKYFADFKILQNKMEEAVDFLCDMELPT